MLRLRLLQVLLGCRTKWTNDGRACKLDARTRQDERVEGENGDRMEGDRKGTWNTNLPNLRVVSLVCLPSGASLRCVEVVDCFVG